MQTSYGCIFKKKSSIAVINITSGVPGRTYYWWIGILRGTCADPKKAHEVRRKWPGDFGSRSSWSIMCLVFVYTVPKWF